MRSQRGRIFTPSPLNVDHPLARGLVGMWLGLPELAGGPRLFDTTRGNHGTLTNGPAWATSPNEFGGVNFIAALGQHILGSVDPTNAATVITVRCWYKPTTLPTTTTILGWASAGGPQFRVESNGALRWVKQDVADIGSGTAGAVVAGVWKWLEGTYDSAGGTFRFWVNGVPAGNGSNAQALTYSAYRLGCKASGSEYADGILADLQILTGRLQDDTGALASYQQAIAGYPDLLNRYRPWLGNNLTSGWILHKEVKYAADGIPPGDLSGFPVPVWIDTDADIASALGSGGGIKFTTADGLTDIPFGLYPSTNLAAGTVHARVKIDPDTDALVGDVAMRLYYAADKPTLEHKATTVNNGYVLFMPMEESPAWSLLTGLVSYWKLNQATGVRYDSHGNNHFTPNGNVGSVAGIIDNAATFVSTNSEDMSNAAPSGLTFDSTNWTIAGWVKLASGQAGFKGVFQQLNFHAPRVYFSGDTLTCDAGADRAISIGDAATGDWVFFAVRWDGTTLKGRLNNGSDVTDSTGTYDVSGSSGPIYLGSLAGANFMDGSVDELGTWMRDLSDDELLNLYNAGAGLTYPFGAASPKQMYDWATESYIGTSVGSMTSGDLVDEQVGKGLEFDGTDDAITVSPVGGLSAYATISANVRLDSAGNFPIIVGGTSNWGNGELRFQGSDRAPAWTGFGVPVSSAVSPDAVTLGEWHQIVGTSDNSAATIVYKVWVDGVEKDSQTHEPGTPVSSAVVDDIGSRGGSSLFFPGVIGEVSAASVVRSADWIAYSHTTDFNKATLWTLGPEQGGGVGGKILQSRQMHGGMREMQGGLV